MLPHEARMIGLNASDIEQTIWVLHLDVRNADENGKLNPRCSNLGR
jgi:hypothetical protein